jgi:hypothetical protein
VFRVRAYLGGTSGHCEHTMAHPAPFNVEPI